MGEQKISNVRRWFSPFFFLLHTKKCLCRPKTLAFIETHINTNYSTEAWILLSMIAPKITSKTPEIVVAELLKNFNADSVRFLHVVLVNRN